jgi:hypothetical protein
MVRDDARTSRDAPAELQKRLVLFSQQAGNLAITILRLAGAASIAAALRRQARRPDRPLRTIMNC